MKISINEATKTALIELDHKGDSVAIGSEQLSRLFFLTGKIAAAVSTEHIVQPPAIDPIILQETPWKAEKKPKKERRRTSSRPYKARPYANGCSPEVVTSIRMCAMRHPTWCAARIANYHKNKISRALVSTILSGRAWVEGTMATKKAGDPGVMSKDQFRKWRLGYEKLRNEKGGVERGWKQ